MAADEQAARKWAHVCGVAAESLRQVAWNTTIDRPAETQWRTHKLDSVPHSTSGQAGPKILFLVNTFAEWRAEWAQRPRAAGPTTLHRMKSFPAKNSGGMSPPVSIPFHVRGNLTKNTLF